MNNRKSPPDLILNAIPLVTNWDEKVRVAHIAYENHDILNKLREELAGTHVVRRRGDSVEIAAVSENLPLPGNEIETVRIGDLSPLLAWRLYEWFVESLFSIRKLARRKKTLIVFSDKPDDNLMKFILPKECKIPHGIALQVAIELEPRIVQPFEKKEVYVTLNPTTRISIDTPINDLINAGVKVDGLYVRRGNVGQDQRLTDNGRLTGKIQRISNGVLELSDHDEEWPTLNASEARLEPRLENFANVLSQLFPHIGNARTFLEKIKLATSKVSKGRESLNRILNIANFLQRKKPLLLDDIKGSFRPIVSFRTKFPKNKIISKPALLFDVRGVRSDRWHQRGLDSHGPYDRYNFNPKKLNIVVICQKQYQGRVEQFVNQLFYGVPGVQYCDVGFLRRFELDRPYVNIFTTQTAKPSAYHEAMVAAIEYITDKEDYWNLAIVQIEEYMEHLTGDENPYSTTKAFFLSRGVAVQHVHFETMNQPQKQRGYSLNNFGLACYAKLGGIPWLLPSDQTIAHELVIGLGSHHERNSRFGSTDRYVGITTVFTGDGRYLLESRTRAVPFDQYGDAMLDAVQSAVEKIRVDFAWEVDDPVRLVFHAFKPLKNVEAEAVHSLMSNLSIPHAEYAFLHIADQHPFQVYDRNEEGAYAGPNKRKGIAAPPRGLIVYLSRYEALLALKGARELKQTTDGHPRPQLIRLHRESTFRDLTYLTQQAFAFACHSWRSFLPAPTPITILYSQLVADGLRDLSKVSNWSDDNLVGRIGRTRWFL